MNRASHYVFLNNVANERMRRDKRKVRYVFLDEQSDKKDKVHDG